LPDGNEEISKENEQAVQFNQEPGQGPAEEDEEDTGGEGGCSLEFLGAGEEDQCFLDADDEGQADQEEDLGGVSGVCVCSGGCVAYISHSESVEQVVLVNSSL
jgi:hypothetical protein